MAESTLAARAKIRPPCMLKHRVQQEHNSLLVNASNRIFKSNLPLNNFKWLLAKLELSYVRNIVPRSKSGASKTRPRWAAHTRIGSVREYPRGGPERAPFFTILADETTDVSNTEQLCISIRFVDQNCSIHEEFLGFVPLGRTTGEAVATSSRPRVYDGESSVSSVIRGTQAFVR